MAGWLILTPLVSYADEITINLDAQTPFVDTVVEVAAPTQFVIETTTGPRFETVEGQIVERVAWVDSWIEVRQGEVVLRADDDSNHNSQTNYYASRITGTLESGTYTIRATSYDYVVGGQTPIGTYTLSSNLIEVPEAVISEPNNNSSNLVTEETTSPPAGPVTPQEPIQVPSIPYNPPIELDTTPAQEPTTEEPSTEPSEEEVVVDEESAPVDEPSIEDTTEQPTQDTEQENQSEEPIDTPIEEIVDEPTSQPEENQEPITAEEVDNLVEELTADGNLSAGDREVIAEALVEASEGEPITAETIEEAGLTYEDLPASTPVEVREDENGNAVVITAEVAAALTVLESPVELLTTIFDDPAQALLALQSIGADMSDEEREESEKTIVAAVIVGGIAVQSVTSAAVAGSVSYRRRV